MINTKWIAIRKNLHKRLGRFRDGFWIFLRSFKSPYQFSLRERFVHDPSKDWDLPKIEVFYNDAIWLQLKIEKLHFFWPIEFDTRELPWLYLEVFTPPDHNPHSYEYGEVKIRKGDWVIDGGACEGFFTAFALSRGANVLAVEPVKLLCNALHRTYEKEIGAGRVKILQACLGEDKGMTTIYENPKSISTTVMTGKDLFGENVPVLSIDNIISEGVIPRVDFIKMDIEGGELAAIKGSLETIRKSHPTLSIAVYHDLANANLIKQIIYSKKSDYEISFRGLYSWDQCIPRPYMLFGLKKL